MKDKAPITLWSLNLHWIIALGILILLATGFYMSSYQAYALFDWHKTLGVFISALLLVRIVYRLRVGWPEPGGRYKAWEHQLSRLVHWCLLLGIVALPISGFMYSGLGGHGVPFLGWELIPSRHIDGVAQPYSALWSGVGKTAHTALGWLLLALIVLHIVGALKHHIIDRDDTLKRMFRGNLS